jgi:hypothetical protein
MTDPDRPPGEGDFLAGPPPRSEIDERLQSDAPTEEGQLPFAGGPRDIDVRKKLGPRGKLLLGLLPVALAAGGWFLGGGVAWMLIALGSAGLLGLIALRYLPSIDFLGRRHFLTFGYLVLCWAAWVGVGYFLPLTTVKVRGDLIHGMKKEPDCPLRVSYGGAVLADLERGRECKIQFRGRFNRDRLTIQTLGPEGWIERSFRDYGNEVALEEIPTVSLYVDNRKHGAVELGCGQLRWAIAADKHQALRVPAGVPCSLTLDGKEVGVLEGKENALVDTRGTRSYRLRKIVYGGIINRLARPGPDLLANWPITLEGKHVHSLPAAIDYFLEPAPKEIKVTTLGGLPTGRESRWELLEREP